MFFIVVGGIALSFVGASTATTSNAGPTSRLPGVSLSARPAGPALAVIAHSGEPPSDVVDSLVLPSTAVASGHLNRDRGVGQYDRSVTFSVPAAPREVIAFYRAEMAHHGWSLMPLGAVSIGGGRTTELLYERAASDGYYWEAAIIVKSVVPRISPALAGASQTAPTAGLELDVIQVGDSA